MAEVTDRLSVLEELDRLAPQLERALEYAGGWTVDDIREHVADGRMQLWPGRDSVIVTQIAEKPRWKELHFFLAAGNMEEIRRAYPVVISWGAEQGCSRATFIGRRGWERTWVTRDGGWTSTLALFVKEITNGQGLDTDRNE